MSLALGSFSKLALSGQGCPLPFTAGVVTSLIRFHRHDRRQQGEPFPTRADLDAAFPDRPVWLGRIDGHASWANTAALRAAGIDPDAAAPPAPEGGAVIQDAAGRPTGVFVDAAAGYSWLDYDNDRYIVFGDYNERAQSDTEGTQKSFTLGGGYNFELGRFVGGPSARFEYHNLDVDGY